MKTISVTELSGNWPAAEKLLAREAELVVVQDSTPVARLVRMEQETDTRKPFDYDAHTKWQEETFGKGLIADWTTKSLREERDQR